MEVIIIAVIALVVLAILSYIFIAKIGPFGTTATDCESKAPGAKCIAKTEGCTQGYAAIPGLCPENTDVCCVPLTTSE